MTVESQTGAGVLIVERGAGARAPRDIQGSRGGGPGLPSVYVALPAAEEAQFTALYRPAVQKWLGDAPIAARTAAILSEAGAARVGNALLRERLLYEGVDLWHFIASPLYSPLLDAVAAVEVCDQLLVRYRPERVVLQGVGNASDDRWRYILSVLTANRRVAFADAASSSGPSSRETAARIEGLASRRPVRIPCMTVGFGEWVMRHVGRWLSRLASVRRPAPNNTPAPLVIVSWSRHWTRLFDAVTGEDRLGDEQFDAIVAAATAAGFAYIVGLDVYSGYRRRGSSPVRVVLRDFPDGFRALVQRLWKGRPVHWRTFHSCTSPVARRRFPETRRWLIGLAREALASEEVAAAFTYRGVSLLPLLSTEIVRAFAASGAEGALALDTAGEFVGRTRPAAILLTNKDHPAVMALIAEAARAGVPSVGLQDGAYSRWGFEFPPPVTTRRIFDEPHRTMIPSVTCVWGQALKDILIRYAGFPDDAVAVTGNWRYDPILSAGSRVARDRLCARFGLDGRSRIVVLATPDLPESPGLASWLVRSLRDHPEFQLVVKPHPGQDQSVYAHIIKNEGTGRERLIVGHLYEVLLVCDVLITEASTVALEAILLGKPVIETAMCTTPRREYVESGVALGVAADGDIVAALRSALTDRQTIERLAAGRGAFIAEHLCSADGRAAERVVQVVQRLVRDAAAPGARPAHSSVQRGRRERPA